MRYEEKNRHLFIKSAETVAPWLLGKQICCTVEGETRKLRITETEAYPASDSACYGYKKDPTEATAPLFRRGGTCCIYAGMLLISCGKEGEPENVLIRQAGNENIYCDGPIKLCNELKIGKSFHGTDLLAEDSMLWIEDDPIPVRHCATQRVGLSFEAKEEDREAPRRFITL